MIITYAYVTSFNCLSGKTRPLVMYGHCLSQTIQKVRMRANGKNGQIQAILVLCCLYSAAFNHRKTLNAQKCGFKFVNCSENPDTMLSTFSSDHEDDEKKKQQPSKMQREKVREKRKQMMSALRCDLPRVICQGLSAKGYLPRFICQGLSAKGYLPRVICQGLSAKGYLPRVICQGLSAKGYLPKFICQGLSVQRI